MHSLGYYQKICINLHFIEDFAIILLLGVQILQKIVFLILGTFLSKLGGGGDGGGGCGVAILTEKNLLPMEATFFL